MGLSASACASTFSILLVAVYQLITIRIDPFGARHIITTPRCLAACAATWGFASVVTIPSIFFPHNNGIALNFLNISILLVIIITGICYCLIYRAVAKGTGGGLEDQIAGRHEENKRILRTFGFVYGTTATFAILVLIVINVLLHIEDTDPSLCLERSLERVFDVLLTSDSMANSIIYWWRLKEFRSILSVCCHARWRRATVPVM